MEEELIAQRNAAIAVSKQLQHQLLSHDARIERNALNAEKLRLQSQYNYEVKSLQLNFQSKKFHRHLQIVVYSFILGALLSWLTSLCFTILFELPILGHLLFLPLHVLFTSIYYFHQKVFIYPINSTGSIIFRLKWTGHSISK